MLRQIKFQCGGFYISTGLPCTHVYARVHTCITDHTYRPILNSDLAAAPATRLYQAEKRMYRNKPQYSVTAHRSLWRYIGGGCKSKYCAIDKCVSQNHMLSDGDPLSWGAAHWASNLFSMHNKIIFFRGPIPLCCIISINF
jgi:hypothetical protein